MTVPVAGLVRQFRVYAGPTIGSGLYVQVRIFINRRAMLAALRAEARRDGTGERYHRNTQGCMQAITRTNCRDNHSRTRPCFGTVNLHRQALGQEVITHEFTHAMFAWADRKRLLRVTGDTLDMTVEEQFCYALGRMVTRFVDRAYKLALYDA